MTALWAFLTSRLGRLLAGIAALLAVIGAARWDKGRDVRREIEADKARDALKAHERMNDAPDLRDASDDDRREWLRNFAERNRRP